MRGMNLKKLTDQAKAAIDKRGGTEALKGDFAELKTVAQGKGTLKEKAQEAADRLKQQNRRSATDPSSSADAPSSARDLPPRP